MAKRFAQRLIELASISQFVCILAFAFAAELFKQFDLNLLNLEEAIVKAAACAVIDVGLRLSSLNQSS